MSGRGLSSNLVTLTTADNFGFLLFVKLEFDSGTVYLHNGVGTITWDSQNWLGVGDFGSVEPIEEGVELSPYELVLMLSGIDADLIDEVMNQDYYLRPVTLYFGALTEGTGALTADPDELWAGFISMADVSRGQLNGIRLTCDSEFAMFERANNSRFSDADLQRNYSGDLLLQYAEQMEERQVVWGGAEQGLGDRVRGHDQFLDNEDFYATR